MYSASLTHLDHGCSLGNPVRGETLNCGVPVIKTDEYKSATSYNHSCIGLHMYRQCVHFTSLLKTATMYLMLSD